MTIPAQWTARIQLDHTIDPSRGAPPSTVAREIFLTGATGFLGAFLLEDLLRTTDARVHCLVRAPSVDAASERLRAALAQFKIAIDFDGGRIVCVPGDLGKPQLGLSASARAALAEEIEAIVHCGAQVALIQGYQQLEAPNVGGTMELLRLATERRLKPVDYISTIATAAASAASGSGRVLESDPIDLSIATLRSGYAQSKWVAEKLVAAAMSRGVPARIFRPGYVSGHTQSGVSSLDDNRLALIKVCVETGIAPALDASLDFAPVDLAAAAIVAIGKAEASRGQAFHVYNPHTVPWATVVEWLNASGYPVRIAPPNEWAKVILSPEVAARRDRASQFTPFQAQMDVAWLERRAPPIDCSHLVAGLVGTGIEIPRVDAALWQRYIAYLVETKFLPPATRGATS